MRSTACAATLSVLLCAGFSGAQSQDPSWKISSESEPEIIAPRIEYLKKSLRKNGGGNSSKATLHLVQFRGPGFTLKVVDQGDNYPGRYSNVTEAMQKNFCIAGCNGGFFLPDFKPSGLVIADGARLNRFANAKLLSGILLVDERGPRILRNREFKDHAGIRQLIQSGPFIVDGGKTVAGLSGAKNRNRTFIMTGTREGVTHWAIGLCMGISLADLGLVLADPAIVSAFKVERALNLDGGTSSSLYFNRGAGVKPFSYIGFKKVRNFIGIAREEPR